MFVKRLIGFSCAAITGLFLLTGCSESPTDTGSGKPEIINQPENKAANFGDSVAFVVVATGDPLPTYQWYKENAPISGAVDSILKVRNITLSDSGSYYVILTNSKGELKSEVSRLLISGGEPVIGAQSNSDTVKIGTSRTLFIQVAGNPPFSYSWFKNDTLLSTEHDSTLILDSITLKDVGNYHAIVSNSIGVDTSKMVTIEITPAKVFIAESDFQSGLLEWMSTSNNKISSPGLSINSDAALQSYGGDVYVIERYGADNILKFDPSKSGESGVVYQTHLGNNWNPQDMEFVSSTKAFISNMNVPNITVFNPSTGQPIKQIDISRYTFHTDSNSTPYAGDMALVGSDLYVMLQKRDGYLPGAPTQLLKINTTTDEITDSITLQFKNGSSMSYYDGALYCCNPGSSYSNSDGGIEKVDLATKTVSTIIDEKTMGGNPNQIVHKSGNLFYVINYIGWQNVNVIEIDVSTGKVVSTLPNVKNSFGGMYYDDVDGKLYVSEADAAEMGVRVFKDNQQIGSPVKSSKSLPPIGMVVVR